MEQDILRISEAYVVLLDAIRGDRVEEVFAEQIITETPVVDNQDASEVDPYELELELVLTQPVEPVAVIEQPTQPVAVIEQPPVVVIPPVDQITEIPATYTVQAGDNLLFISLKFYGTTQMVNQIMAYNNIINQDSIQAGNVLVLPRMP